jgi:hypothetical protein
MKGCVQVGTLVMLGMMLGGTSALYSSNSDVVQLDEKSFKKQVHSKHVLWQSTEARG